MSTRAKETLPSRCYCRVQDEQVSLNDIVKIITALNLKALQLRNEVNAFKNINANVGKKLPEKSEETHEQCEECPDIFRSNANLDRLPKDTLTHSFRNDLINKSETREDNVDLSTNGESSQNEIKNKNNCSRVYTDPPKIRKKKISRNAQCNLLTEHKRKSFLDYFRIKPFIKGRKVKANKVKNSARIKNNVIFNSRKDNVELSNGDISENVELKNYEGCQILYPIDAREETIDGHFEPSQILSTGEKNTSNQSTKLQENKVSKTELDEYKEILHKDTENEDQIFKCSITGRMGGGAEFHGSRLISDLTNRMQNMNLYKHVKFDARNVKRRLDACIAELNEIIEDVSLIFPDTDISKE